MSGPSSGARTLSRDYKDVRRHKHVAVGHTSFNGWVGLGVGLSLGLLVALGVHLHYTRQAQATAEPVPAPPVAPASATATDDAMVGAPETSAADPGLDFYDMLPKQEVEVPAHAKGDKTTTRSPLPTGDVVLQAGSFKQPVEAEKMVAKLAYLGIDARIQRAPVDDETWYRVRIGPIETVEELHTVQSKLQEAEISATPVTPVEEAPLP